MENPTEIDSMFQKLKLHLEQNPNVDENDPKFGEFIKELSNCELTSQQLQALTDRGLILNKQKTETVVVILKDTRNNTYFGGSRWTYDWSESSFLSKEEADEIIVENGSPSWLKVVEVRPVEV